MTYGFRRFQESQVRALRIGHLLLAVYVDAIDESGRKGKRWVFSAILEEHRLSRQGMPVVGDSAESKIETGNRLAWRTVLGVSHREGL